MRTPICDELGIEFPIFAFSHCRDVVTAVSRAGGLGVLGAVALTPDELEAELAWIDAHVGGKPYGVDVVMPQKFIGKGDAKMPSIDELRAAIPERHRAWLRSLLDKHGVPELPDDTHEFKEVLSWGDDIGRALVKTALRHPIKLIVNALGTPPADVIAAAHDHGVKVGALIGTVKQALSQKAAGVDLIIASGYEAGGHTGEITTFVLVPQVVDAVAPTPVLAAGGIASGRQVAAALALGAQGAWTGSIWLTTAESEVLPAFKQKLIEASSEMTERSRCLSGKPARMLKNAYTEAWKDPACPGTLAMPLQGMLVAEAEARMRRYNATSAEGSDQLFMQPVGQCVGQMNAERPAARVVQELVTECLDAIERVHAHVLRAAE